MKTQNTILISALALFCTLQVNAQETERKVQMRIIENGKVLKDTTFSVKENVNGQDIGRVERMLNKEDVFEFRELPRNRGFAYGFHFDGPRYKEFDSIMNQRRMYFYQDSLFEDFAKRFDNDSLFAFRNFEHRGRAHPMGRPHQFMFEKDIISHNDDFGAAEDEVIIRKNKPGKKQIIIRDDNGDVKTIRKKLDKDTEVIIIKKR